MGLFAKAQKKVKSIWNLVAAKLLMPIEIAIERFYQMHAQKCLEEPFKNAYWQIHVVDLQIEQKKVILR